MTLVKAGRPTRAETQRRAAVVSSRASGNVTRRKALPEYLDAPEVEALIAASWQNPDAQVAMLVQWRAGLRVSEAITLTPADVLFDATPPVLRVREGKGGKPRLVPLHPELGVALINHIRYRRIINHPLIAAHRRTVWRWYKTALAEAQRKGTIPEGRHVATHTLRHSAARHWLASGVPINRVSVWLGHASLQTTLIYLQILPDPGNDMERVP